MLEDTNSLDGAQLVLASSQENNKPKQLKLFILLKKIAMQEVFSEENYVATTIYLS